MERLVLIRGLPGSGKSTLAREYVRQGWLQLEADQFFVGADGVYRFDPAKLPEAHQWCIRLTALALAAGQRVVVSNTFVRLWELQPYLELEPGAKILVATGRYQNLHGVPDAVVARMAAAWEDHAA